MGRAGGGGAFPELFGEVVVGLARTDCSRRRQEERSVAFENRISHRRWFLGKGNNRQNGFSQLAKVQPEPKAHPSYWQPNVGVGAFCSDLVGYLARSVSCDLLVVPRPVFRQILCLLQNQSPEGVGLETGGLKYIQNGKLLKVKG